MSSQKPGRRLEPVESVVAPPRKCLPHDGAVNHGESRSCRRGEPRRVTFVAVGRRGGAIRPEQMNSRHLPLQASFSVLDISPLPAYAIHPIPLRPVIFLTTATSALFIVLSTSRCTRQPYDRYCSPDMREHHALD